MIPFIVRKFYKINLKNKYLCLKWKRFKNAIYRDERKQKILYINVEISFQTYSLLADRIETRVISWMCLQLTCHTISVTSSLTDMYNNEIKTSTIVHRYLNYININLIHLSVLTSQHTHLKHFFLFGIRVTIFQYTSLFLYEFDNHHETSRKSTETHENRPISIKKRHSIYINVEQRASINLHMIHSCA